MESQEKLEQQAQYLRAIFDAIPQPAFVVDGDLRIYDFNTAAEEYLAPDPAAALHRRGGEALHCIHSEESGCGKSEICKDCVIRESVTQALVGRATCRAMHAAELRTPAGIVAIDLLVSATLLPYTEPPRAILVLENVTELYKLRRRRKPARKRAAPADH